MNESVTKNGEVTNQITTGQYDILISLVQNTVRNESVKKISGSEEKVNNTSKVGSPTEIIVYNILSFPR